MSRETLSPSRMSCLLECPRKHYYRYELGIERASKSDALLFGSAWADFKQNFRKGMDPEAAFMAALDSQKERNLINMPLFAGMALAYCEIYGVKDDYATLLPEVGYDRPLDEIKGAEGVFNAFGRLDAIAATRRDEHVIFEDKTTGQDIDIGAPYWLRLRFNPQILEYVYEAAQKGWNVWRVVYEVARKPKLEKKIVPELDANGLKWFSVDATGQRMLNKDGSPRQTASEGTTLRGRMETDEELAERIKQEILGNPSRYFVRRDVDILSDQLTEFVAHRSACARLIVHLRAQEGEDRESAWPRNIDTMRCTRCDYGAPCLQGWKMDPANLPEGYEVKRRTECEQAPEAKTE